ncbi:DNA-binding protein [Caballeronia calidae]|uniref:DNA-binding protein n=2 Tax=Caballeronia calidae TaxID=1777139 RepID=A0A158CBS1_9BURK|nr:DNA-binding protein [Caballeronia calidae]
MCYIAHRLFNDSTVERTKRANDSMSNIQLDIEWTEAASRKIEKLMPRNVNKEAYLALPPVECLPMEGDVLFLGPAGKQQPFIVAERQYHHDGEADWTIILILDVPQETH